MILPLLLRFWPYLAIGLLSLSLWGALKYGRHEHDMAEQATEIANANAQIAEQERKERDRMVSIADDLTTKIKASTAKYSTIKRKVADAPQSDDGPIAPVLRGVLDELRQPTKAVGPDDSLNPARTSAVPGQAKPARP